MEDFLLTALRFERDDTQAFSEHASTDSQKISAEVEDLNNALTIMYLFVETARLQMRERKGTSLRDGLGISIKSQTRKC